MRALGEKAIARMHSPTVRSRSSADDRAGIEIGRRATSGNVHSGIGADHVQTVGVIVAVQRHSGIAQFGSGAHDAQCDFTTIDDEESAGRHDYARV